MAEENRLDAALVSVDGSDLPAERHDLLRLVRVETSVQLPDAFTLRFDDPYFELFDAAEFSIGSEVAIAFRAESDPVVATSGEVTAISVEPGPSGRHELVVTGLDVAHRLARGPRSRTFLQVTDADIVSQIADEHGLTGDIQATGEVHEYVLQHHETDRAFATRLARRCGYDLWVSDRTLHFRERPTADGGPGPLRWGDNLEAFKVRYTSTERCDEVTVRGWDPVAKRGIVGRAADRDLGATAPAADELADDARSAFGDVERCAGQFPVADQAEADALAGALLARATGGEFVAKGVAIGDPRIVAGAEVEVEGMGERLSGRYLVTSVEHRYTVGSPFRTRFVCGGKDPSSLLELTGGGSSTDADARRWGHLVVGLVTNADDPEQLGRVKVMFPSLSDEEESAWARLVTPGGGPGRGLQCLPEVGDEVVVAFELDDEHRPLVLGGLWNRQDPPPAPDVVSGGEVAARLWRSRTGHQLHLDDDGEAVELALGDQAAGVRLTGPASTLHGDRELRLTAQEIEIEAERGLRLSAPRIEIDGSTEVKVSGGTIRLN